MVLDEQMKHRPWQPASPASERSRMMATDQNKMTSRHQCQTNDVHDAYYDYCYLIYLAGWVGFVLGGDNIILYYPTVDGI